jgi:Cytochrome C oxidase, cbb3-type, subunit III
MKTMPNGYLVIVFAALLALMVISGAGSDARAKSQNRRQPEKLIYSLNGRDLFRAYCAPCHGVDGKGQGPVAPALKQPLPDLTTIAKNNAGIYPAERVRNLIAGDEVLMGHGSREMPIWGPIFHQIENDRDYGILRLQNVTEHLRSIQQK